MPITRRNVAALAWQPACPWPRWPPPPQRARTHDDRPARRCADQVLKAPEMQARLTQLGLLPSTDAPAAFEQNLRDDLAYWKKAIAETAIRIEP